MSITLTPEASKFVNYMEALAVSVAQELEKKGVTPEDLDKHTLTELFIPELAEKLGDIAAGYNKGIPAQSIESSVELLVMLMGKLFSHGEIAEVSMMTVLADREDHGTDESVAMIGDYFSGERNTN